MLAVTLGVVLVGLLIVAVVGVRRRRAGDPPALSSSEPPETSALGQVPGYMPGMRRRAEPHDATAAELVVPPSERDAAVDLPANEFRLRRPR